MISEMNLTHNPIIIFDVDGPLLPNKGPRLLVLKLKHNPWFKWNDDEKKKHTSLDIIRLFESAESESNRDYFNKIRVLFKKMIPKWFRRWSFFIAMGVKLRQYEYRYDDFIPGVVEVIKYLHEKGYLMTICSNSEESRINRWLKAKKITQYIPKFTSRNQRSMYGLKPDPRPLLGALLMLKNHHGLGKIDKNNVVFIGDNITDIMAAKRANIKSIGVLSGHAYKHELEEINPDFIIPTVAELPSILMNVFPEYYSQ